MSVIASSTVSRPSLSRRTRALAPRTSPRIAEASTEADKPAAVADAGGRCDALVPAEAGSTHTQRFREMARGERPVVLGIALGIVAQAQFHGSRPRASANSSMAHSRPSNPIASPGAHQIRLRQIPVLRVDGGSAGWVRHTISRAAAQTGSTKWSKRAVCTSAS